MLFLLRKNSTPADVDGLLALARELGYETRLLDRNGLILELVPAPGRPRPDRAGHRSRFEDKRCVRAVLDNDDAPERADVGARPGGTVVRVGDAVFGGGAFSIVAGPCAVEDAGRLREIAREVRRAGAGLLRGGAFKPRTSPYSFQGLGAEGLALLADVKRELGMPIVTEVLDPREVERVARVADVLQIGSRSMSNATLLVEAGRSGCTVLVKRGLAATAREFLLAAEYVLAQGNDRVLLCERGIRGFDDVTRNVLDVGMIAWLKRHTHLPVVVDPSHAAGRSDLVLPLARAGVAAGADGLIVEVHPEPSEVHSDGNQAVSFAQFGEIVRAVEALLALDGRTLAAPRARQEAVT